MYYKLYSDAAKYPDSNQIGTGALLISAHKQSQAKFNLIAADNHEAEFKACIKSLEFLKSKLNKQEMQQAVLMFYTDSKILAESLNKKYAKHYQNYVDKIIESETDFNLVFNNWIPESKNHGAHNLAIQALHDIN